MCTYFVLDFTCRATVTSTVDGPPTGMHPVAKTKSICKGSRITVDVQFPIDGVRLDCMYKAQFEAVGSDIFQAFILPSRFVQARGGSPYTLDVSTHVVFDLRSMFSLSAFATLCFLLKSTSYIIASNCFALPHL